MAKIKNGERIPVREFTGRGLNYKPKRLVIRDHNSIDGFAPSFGVAEVVEKQMEKLSFSPNVNKTVTIPCEVGWYEPQVYTTPEVVEVVLFEHNGRLTAVGSLESRLMLAGRKTVEMGSELLDTVASVVGGRSLSDEEWLSIPEGQRPETWLGDWTKLDRSASLEAGENGKTVFTHLEREGRPVINGHSVGFAIDVPDSAVVYKDQSGWKLEFPS